LTTKLHAPSLGMGIRFGGLLNTDNARDATQYA